MEHGIFKMDDEKYFAIDAVSQSGLSRMAKAPCLYHTTYKATPAMLQGTLIHTLVLEGMEAFKTRYTVTHKVDKRTKAGKAEWSDMMVQAGDRILITQDQYDAAVRVQNAICHHPGTEYLFNSGYLLHHNEGRSEMAIFWQDPETGIECKGKIDYLRNDIVVDLKTSKDASSSGFTHSVSRFNYHVQAAFYLRGLRELNQEIEDFIFVVVEETDNKPLIGIYRLDNESLEKGNEFCDEQLKIYAECVKSGNWPGLPEEIQTISIN